MMLSTIQFWVIVQVVVDLLLIIFFVIFMRQLKASGTKKVLSGLKPLPQELGPLLKDAERLAGKFEVQLKEKQRLVRKLNEHLDKRVISLNLLLNRAEICLASDEKESCGKDRRNRHVYDLQEEIIGLGEKGIAPDEIANRMGISKGEVTLVLELKRKFQEMEKSN